VEYSSNSVQQVCDALAIAAVVTVTVHCDNSQATRLQFSSTSGLQRDQLQSSSQDNENCCVQFSSLWAATVEYSTMPSPVVGLKTSPIVRASEERSTLFEQRERAARQFADIANGKLQ